MAYTSISQMASSTSLTQRAIACAAQEGKPNPQAWVAERMLRICSTPEWVTAWDYAVDNGTVNVNPDTGIRTDVISDEMILDAVTAITT